ncbi:MAG: ABC transporter six-transmembrane domain-containing protein [Thiolinea sp.]
MKTLKQYRGPLALTYSLSLIQQLLGVAFPGLIGWAINDLLVNSYRGLIVMCLAWFLLSLIMASRMMYDTRVFMRIYTQITHTVIVQQKASGVDSSKLMARSVLLKETIDFFERDVPSIISITISFIGSLAMLALFNLHISLVALLMLIPVSLLNINLWKPMHRLNRSLNNNLERQVRVIETGTPAYIDRHFEFLRFLKIKLSDIEARNLGLTECFVIGVTAYIFIYTAKIPQIEAGTIFSVVTYFWSFQGSMDRLPMLLQSISRVKDVLRRIAEI